MQVYQIDASISDRGIINLPSMPYLYNKKVTLVIISAEDNLIMQSEQRKSAMEQLLKIHDTMPTCHWTDEELDNIRYEYLKEKYQ